jgi:NTE family protein
LGLRDHYFAEITTLARSALPTNPRFIFCATELTHGVDFIFERTRAGSHQRQLFDDDLGGWEVARAVAASSCFPPIFQPLPINIPSDSRLQGLNAQAAATGSTVTSRLELSDGGVYDNLGIEPVWRDSATLLVSDGGAPFTTASDRGLFWRLNRWAAIGGHAAGSMRKRWLISNYLGGGLTGAYWGIGSSALHYSENREGYGLELVRRRIANIRTDLDVFSDAEAEVLQNHGYSLADAAIRVHAPALAATASPFVWPYPNWAPQNSRSVAAALRNSSRLSLLGHEPWWRLPGKVVRG